MQTRDDMEFYRLLAEFYAALGNSQDLMSAHSVISRLALPIGYEEGWVLVV